MSFEQLDNERRYEKKQKDIEEKNKEDFWLEKEIRRESSELLNNLATQIAKEFWIEISEAKNLISWEISWSLDSLKSSISQNPIDKLKLWEAILGAKSSIEDLSKKHREKLKQSLNQKDYIPEDHNYMSSKKILSENIIIRARNPKSISDQIIWIGVGSIDSVESVIVYSYQLWKWILLSPYHLYLLLTWKAKYTWFKNV